jgi:hypothetical protein
MSPRMPTFATRLVALPCALLTTTSYDPTSPLATLLNVKTPVPPDPLIVPLAPEMFTPPLRH